MHILRWCGLYAALPWLETTGSARTGPEEDSGENR